MSRCPAIPRGRLPISPPQSARRATRRFPGATGLSWIRQQQGVPDCRQSPSAARSLHLRATKIADAASDSLAGVAESTETILRPPRPKKPRFRSLAPSAQRPRRQARAHRPQRARHHRQRLPRRGAGARHQPRLAAVHPPTRRPHRPARRRTGHAPGLVAGTATPAEHPRRRRLRLHGLRARLPPSPPGSPRRTEPAVEGPGRACVEFHARPGEIPRRAGHARHLSAGCPPYARGTERASAWRPAPRPGGAHQEIGAEAYRLPPFTGPSLHLQHVDIKVFYRLLRRMKDSP